MAQRGSEKKKKNFCAELAHEAEEKNTFLQNWHTGLKKKIFLRRIGTRGWRKIIFLHNWLIEVLKKYNLRRIGTREKIVYFYQF